MGDVYNCIMATGSSSTVTAVRSASSANLAGYDQFIDKQLRRTRAQVRTVDVASGLLVLATATLAYFLAMAILDHWVVAGGLPGWARLAALGIYAAGAGWYFLTRILPLLIKRINPLYAAETIERTQPTLKNSLLNFLMFRAQPQGLSQSVYHAVEEQAATNLAHVPIETVVDRSKLIRIGYVLVGVLAATALYKVLSPKDPIATFGRIVMPWADILAPTKVSIDNIQPGNAKAFRGQKVAISAEVHGLDRDGAVTLIYTTADGQTVDRPVEMHLPRDGYRHTCTLPPDDDGVQQTMRYRIVAGDARSREYTISVVAAPTIVVDSIEYVYPDYTGLLSQKIDHQGDIKAIEGTRVIVHAVTNQPIKDGGIDFECDEHEDLPLAVDGTGDLALGATIAFSLGLDDDRVTPLHSSYQLRFRNSDGDANQQPIRHTIEVVADLPPEIEFLAPKKNEVRVREGDALPMELTASDPDFALKSVKLIAESGGRRLFEESLIKSEWPGQFNHKYRFRTKEHHLKAGDVVEYWAVAQDTKLPGANKTETVKRRIQIVPRDAKGQPNQDPQAGDDQPPLDGEPDQPPQGNQDNQGDQPQQNNPDQGEDSQENQGDKGDQGDPKGGDQPDKSQDSESNPKGGENGDSSSEGDQQNSKPQQGGEKQGDQQGESQQGDQPGKQGESKGDAGDKGDQQQGDGASGDKQNGKQDSPVANDGTEDGEAFDEMQKHLQEKQQQDPNAANQDRGDGQTKNENPGSQKSQGENKQTPGQNDGGQEKPSNKKQQPGQTKDDNSGDPTGKENKGEEQPGQSGNPNAQKKPGEQGGPKGQEQAGSANEDAKQGENNQKGEPTDAVSDQAKEEQGQPGKAGKTEKTNEKPTGKGKPEDRQGESNGGNPRDQKAGEKSEQKGQGEHAAGEDRGEAKKPDPGKPREQAKGGSDQEKGESGTGREGSNDEGSPESQGEGRQRKKTPKPSQGEQDDQGKQEAQSPSNSNRESDSDQAESEGDRSGNGKDGGGQKADQPGTGGPGKNTPSDQGTGQSEEKGPGETSGKAGSQKESDSPTGKSGDQAGQGSQSRPGEKAGKGESGAKPQPNGSPADKPGQQQGAPGQGTAQGASGGGEKGTAGDPPPSQGGEPGGDKANLEYTRKATDLIIDKLRDQLEKGEPDRELLDKLGWSREDLENFVRRWERMKAEARDDGRKGEEAKRELDATLRSLGLAPRGTTLSGDRATSDSQRGLRESRRSSPPPEYAEQYKAYTQGTARGGK